MEHLSSLDAGFLEAEDSDPHVSLAIGAVSVVAGPAPQFDELLSAFDERMRTVPRCVQVLHTHPFDLGSPEWVDDPGFEVGHHVHRAALPHPGDDAELFRLIANVMERRLDRERPLWECWIIEGLAGDRWAILLKLHHCIADGIAAAQILSSLSDEGPGDSFATEIRAAKQQHGSASRAPRVNLNYLNPVALADGLWRVSKGTAELMAGLLRPAPRSSLNGPVTAMRRYSVARVSRQDIDLVARVFEVTLNDVALAAIADSYRAVLINRGEQPRRDSLRTLVPVSVRSVDAFNRPDNRVSAMLPFLPVDETDPVKRLQVVHNRLARAKGSGQRQGGSMLVSAANLIPFPLTAWTVRLLTRLPQHGVVALATNVPGPRTRQRVMRREVLEVLPVPPIALQLRTGIAMLSYSDRFVFGITADYDTAPDIEELAQGIERGVARLAAISRTRLRKRGRRPSAAPGA